MYIETLVINYNNKNNNIKATSFRNLYIEYYSQVIVKLQTDCYTLKYILYKISSSFWFYFCIIIDIRYTQACINCVLCIELYNRERIKGWLVKKKKHRKWEEENVIFSSTLCLMSSLHHPFLYFQFFFVCFFFINFLTSKEDRNYFWSQRDELSKDFFKK